MRVVIGGHGIRVAVPSAGRAYGGGRPRFLRIRRWRDRWGGHVEQLHVDFSGYDRARSHLRPFRQSVAPHDDGAHVQGNRRYERAGAPKET